MRILHVIDSLEIGGAEQVVVALANGQVIEHDVTVCCVSRIGALARSLDPRIDLFCMGRGAGNDYFMPFRLARRIRGAGWRVVHCHNWSVFLEAGIAAWIARVPVAVLTIHGPYTGAAPRRSRRLRAVLRHWMERQMASRFSAIVAVSDSIREYIPRVVGIPRARLRTVHNGIAGNSPETVGQPGRLTFIGVGRLDPIKNHELMVRAFARVAAVHSRARLVLLGDGPQRNRLETLRDELQLNDRVELQGFRDDVALSLAHADVFLVSSMYEGISIALLEAMRAGLPVVATRVGGIPETVIPNRTGLLVPAGDVGAFSEAMLALSSSLQLRQQYGAAAMALQREKFSLEAMLQHYGEIYADAACAG